MKVSPSLDMFLMSIAAGMAIRVLFFPDAWEVAWKILSDFSNILRKF